MRVLVWLFNLALAGNGLAMFGFPATWYRLVPGVADTGPFNPHFVRDIGAAYLVVAGGLIAYALNRRARPAALAGCAFLTLHAVIHLWDAAAGRASLGNLLGAVPTVILPGLVLFILLGRGATSGKENIDAAMAAAAPDRRV